MKKWFLAAMVTAFVLATASANAMTHTVVKGECLSKIARQYKTSWQKFYEINKDKISDPNKIYPGQKFAVPDQDARQATASSQTVLAWTNGGLNPYGKRNPAWAVALFDLPVEVKRQMIANLDDGKFESYRMKTGQVLAEQVYDRYKIRRNVVVRLPERQLKADLYPAVSFGGRKYFLIRPHCCYNWSWWSEEEAKVKVEKLPTPGVIETTSEPELEYLSFLIPPPLETVEEVPYSEETVIAEKVCCRPDSDITVGAFADRHQSGNNPHGIWGVANVYLCDIKDGDSIHSLGFAAEGNLWQGVTGDDYHYFGRRYAIGPAYRWLTPGAEFQARIGLGKVDDWGYIRTGPDGRYEADQTSRIVTGYVSHEIRRDQSLWFNRVRSYVSLDLDISRGKADQWVEESGKSWGLNGESGNKTLLNAGVNGSIYRLNQTVSLAGTASLMHYAEGSRTGLRVGPGLDFYGGGSEFEVGTLLGEARVTPTLWSHSDHSVGIIGNVDLSNIVKYIFR